MSKAKKQLARKSTPAATTTPLMPRFSEAMRDLRRTTGFFTAIKTFVDLKCENNDDIEESEVFAMDTLMVSAMECLSKTQLQLGELYNEVAMREGKAVADAR